MSGPIALSMDGALNTILYTCGSRLTLTTQREHAAQIVRGMDSSLSISSFLSYYGQSGDGSGPGHGWPGYIRICIGILIFTRAT